MLMDLFVISGGHWSTVRSTLCFRWFEYLSDYG